MIKVAIIIASNTRSKEINKDETIPLLIDFANANNWEVVDSSIAADEIKELSDKMIYYADSLKVDLVLVSGGTGPSKRYVTLRLCD